MTKKLKKRARAISSKTGMKHQSAVNALKGNETVSINETNRKGLNWLLQQLNGTPKDLLRLFPEAAPTSKELALPQDRWFEEIREAHAEGRTHPEEYRLYPSDLARVFDDSRRWSKETIAALTVSPESVEANVELPADYHSRQEHAKRDADAASLSKRPGRFHQSISRAFEESKAAYEEAYPELGAMWELTMRRLNESGLDDSVILKGADLALRAQDRALQLLDIVHEISSPSPWERVTEKDAKYLEEFQAWAQKALDDWDDWKKKHLPGNI